MSKHKMWLKRCQRESQEQDAPPLPAQQPPLGQQELPSAPAQFTHFSALAPGAPIAPGPQPQLTEPPAFTAEVLHAPLPALAQPASQLQQPAMLPAEDLPAVSFVNASTGLLPASQPSLAAQRPAQGLTQQLQAILRSQAVAQPRLSQPQPAQHTQPPAGLQPPALAPSAGVELPPERMLQPWQSLSGKPSVDRAQAPGRGRPAQAFAPAAPRTVLNQAPPQGALLPLCPHQSWRSSRA